ncbi:unnamed protein product [Lactuca virosa]|uniref:RING-type E3 ubiquitin transferase n=1 Tax=Lactuca virosa TaxID=75947 RepID=A0AAU9LTE2_9ASTR|nr:unnamed protein product [Lactuca virosa]
MNLDHIQYSFVPLFTTFYQLSPFLWTPSSELGFSLAIISTSLTPTSQLSGPKSPAATPPFFSGLYRSSKLDSTSLFTTQSPFQNINSHIRLSSPSKRTYTLIVAMDGTGKGCCLEQESVTNAHKVLDIMSLLCVHPDETTFGYLVYLYATKGLEHKMIELQDLVSRFNLPNKSIFIRCDRMLFSEIMKEDSDIMGCISSRVRHLVQLHYKTDLRKILKKYDKVHNSVSGVNFRSKLQAEHLEILQSPWLIELVAFYMNFSESNEMICYELCSYFSCDLRVIISKLVLKLVLPDYVVLEYSLTCAVCLV